jgi:putative flippase GtrA
MERDRKQLWRYLLVGGANTAFGYFTTIGLYYLLRPFLHLILIAILANVVCITASFVAYKIFVFRSAAGWFREYLRCYVVYGTSAAVGILGLWVLVNLGGMQFWLAQAILMIVSVTVSYIGHDRFTFRKYQKADEQKKTDQHCRGLL